MSILNRIRPFSENHQTPGVPAPVKNGFNPVTGGVVPPVQAGGVGGIDERQTPAIEPEKPKQEAKPRTIRPRPGRRTAVPGHKRDTKVTVSLSRKEFAAVAKAAEKQGISISTLLRCAAFDAYGIPRPHPEVNLTVAQARAL